MLKGRDISTCITVSVNVHIHQPGHILLQAHGDADGVVDYKRGQLTSELVSSLVKDHKFVTYPGMMHEATMEELEDIKTWLTEKL